MCAGDPKLGKTPNACIRSARAGVAMFAGDPKLGKRFVTLALAAAVSRSTTADERRPQLARQYDLDVFPQRRASGRASRVRRLASLFSGRRSLVHERSLQCRQHRRLFQEADQTRQKSYQRNRHKRRLWRGRSLELGTWPPRFQSLIAFKDAKGIKDCRAAARAIFGNFVRSMCARSMHCENSGKPRQPRESREPRVTSRVRRRSGRSSLPDPPDEPPIRCWPTM